MTDTLSAIRGYQRLTVRPLKAPTSQRVVLRGLVGGSLAEVTENVGKAEDTAYQMPTPANDPPIL